MAVKAKKKKINKINKKKRVFKINDKDFWEVYEKCGGMCATAARMIESQFKCKYSRVAVYQRASKDPERMKQVRETIVDIAEAQVIKNMKSDNAMVSQRASEFILHHVGKDRGYDKQQRIELEDKRQVVKTEIVALPELRKIQDDAKMKRAKEKENNKVH